jgi:hypothetical protein
LGRGKAKRENVDTRREGKEDLIASKREERRRSKITHCGN